MDMFEIKHFLKTQQQQKNHCKKQNNITDVENSRILSYDLMSVLQSSECECD